MQQLRVDDFVGKPLVELLLPFAGKKLYTVTKRVTPQDPGYTLKLSREVQEAFPLLRTDGNDWTSLQAISDWIGDGPKFACPDPARCDAMQRIEVRLKLNELGLPFPRVMVVFPDDRFKPYTATLVAKLDEMMCLASFTKDHTQDIATLVGENEDPNWVIEWTLHKHKSDVELDEAVAVAKACRVALNCCLMLSGQIRFSDPHLVASDSRLAKEKTDRGARARKRLKVATAVCEFDQTVYVRHEGPEGRSGEKTGTGSEKCCHWRRGHWHTVAFGTGRALRKKMLFPPTLVRKDLFTGEQSKTTTTYRQEPPKTGP